MSGPAGVGAPGALLAGRLSGVVVTTTPISFRTAGHRGESSAPQPVPMPGSAESKRDQTMIVARHIVRILS